MIPLGLSIAVSIRVGNNVGAGKAHIAKFAILSNLALSLVIALIVTSTLILFRTLVSGLFTNNPIVYELLNYLLPCVAIYQLLDFLQTSMGGSLRGIGYQHIGAIGSFFAFYVLAIPVACYFSNMFPSIAFVNYGVYGIWIGLACGIMLMVFVYGITLLRVNWDTINTKKED